MLDQKWFINVHAYVVGLFGSKNMPRVCMNSDNVFCLHVVCSMSILKSPARIIVSKGGKLDMAPSIKDIKFESGAMGARYIFIKCIAVLEKCNETKIASYLFDI